MDHERKDVFGEVAGRRYCVTLIQPVEGGVWKMEVRLYTESGRVIGDGVIGGDDNRYATESEALNAGRLVAKTILDAQRPVGPTGAKALPEDSFA